MGNLFSVGDKGQEGTLAQVEYSRKAAALAALSKMGMAAQLELRLACRGLPKKDATSKSDPMAVVYTSPPTGQTSWSEVGRTNVVANTADPAFVRPVLVRHLPEGQQPMRVVVVDVDQGRKKPESLNLDSHTDYIGEAEFYLSDVLAAPSQSLELPLLDVKGGRVLPPECCVVLKAEQMVGADDRIVRFAFNGVRLAKKDLMSKSDPFLVVLKLRHPVGAAGGGNAAKPAGQQEEDWVPVLKTEVRDNNSDPVWLPIEVDIRQLCSADEHRPLKLQVWDHNSSGKHRLIGECRSSLAELKALAAGPPNARSIELAAPPGGKGAGSSPGALTVRQVAIRPGPSLSQTTQGCWQSCLS